MIGWSGRSKQSAVARILPVRLPSAAALGRRDFKLKDGAEGLGMLSYQVLSLLYESKAKTNHRYLAKTRSSYYSKRFGFPIEKI